VVLNLSNGSLHVELLSDQLIGGTYRELFSEVSQSLHQGVKLSLKPWEAMVWVSQN
jgi:hypothetical protein